MTRRFASLVLIVALSVPLAARAAPPGYYRYPAIHGDTVVFTAEGDLWRVPVAGGIAERLTSHAGQETEAAISPDGTQVAFAGQYEGPREIYLLPLAGGQPKRLTWTAGARTDLVGWTPSGHVLYSSNLWATLPDMQLFELDPATGGSSAIPLSQANDGVYGPDGTLYFTRLPFQGSHTRRYKGGTAQNLWKFAKGDAEASPLTADYAGTSKTPMWWDGRIYFASDRDGTMNLWSMRPDGSDLTQLTRHDDFEVQSPSLDAGRIAYQHGADIRVYDIGSGTDRVVPITLVSDFDQMREKWITKPVDWITSAHLSPSGDRLVLTARGGVFVAPSEQGRLVEVTRGKLTRWRNARFMPDGTSVLALSDQSGELEFWSLPASGIGAPSQVTTGGTVFRRDGVPSPDGKWLAHRDLDRRLWILDLAKKTETKIGDDPDGDFDDLTWSPDSRFLAYTAPGANQVTGVSLWEAATGTITPVTTDRYESYSPAWSPDGTWLYFLSDRTFVSTVSGPWGSREPEPFFDKQTKIYHVAMVPGLRSPFQPADELMPKDEDKKDEEKKGKEGDEGKEGKGAREAKERKKAPAFTPDLSGIQTRLLEVPLPAGNYGSLSVDEKRLYFLSRESGRGAPTALKTLALERKAPEAETFLEKVDGYELSADRKKLLVRKENTFYVVEPAAKAPGELEKFAVPLKDWRLHFDVRDEWRQMFVEAWRLERDYFYDRGMHGVDWKAVRAKYEPLVDRVTDREELSDLLAQMVSELSALHIFVFGGDAREGADDVWPASLGARLERDQAAGGFRVARIYQSDPDRPDRRSPLARPGVDVHEGDVIDQVNGTSALSVPTLEALLRGEAGRQVRLHVKPASGVARDVIVMPLTPSQAFNLRYDDWEYTRRLAVEKASDGHVGYVHLRAMGSEDIAQWTREYYPVFNRDGLIVDVRHNNGGNIDSWLLGRLLRKAWFYWQPRVGHPYWNMQYAFRGHVVVLVDEDTASDGEAFAEGFRRLGIGKLIGTRTWGGEIWLSADNDLVDRGIATAAEYGVYGPEGAWLIEGHGVDPDIVVDDLPHATFGGSDAQLDAAVKYLQDLIRTQPIPVPSAPPYPIKRLGAPEGPARH